LVSKAETVSSSGGIWQFLYEKTINNIDLKRKNYPKSMVIKEIITTFAVDYQGVPTGVG